MDSHQYRSLAGGSPVQTHNPGKYQIVIAIAQHCQAGARLSAMPSMPWVDYNIIPPEASIR